jgi:hypothetical protein
VDGTWTYFVGPFLILFGIGSLRFGISGTDTEIRELTTTARVSPSTEARVDSVFNLQWSRTPLFDSLPDRAVAVAAAASDEWLTSVRGSLESVGDQSREAVHDEFLLLQLHLIDRVGNAALEPRQNDLVLPPLIQSTVAEGLSRGRFEPRADAPDALQQALRRFDQVNELYARCDIGTVDRPEDLADNLSYRFATRVLSAANLPANSNLLAPAMKAVSQMYRELQAEESFAEVYAREHPRGPQAI